MQCLSACRRAQAGNAADGLFTKPSNRKEEKRNSSKAKGYIILTFDKTKPA